MCVAFYALEHPDYALVLCSNRDEWLTRPTFNASVLPFQTDGSSEQETQEGFMISARDRLRGGTWLGINHLGDVGILTNIAEPPGLFEITRGELVGSFLLTLGHAKPSETHTVFHQEDGVLLGTAKAAITSFDSYISQLVAPENHKNYPGFNLILLSPRWRCNGVKRLRYDAQYVSNGGGHGALTARSLRGDERKYGGISNGTDDGEEWEKIRKGRAELRRVLEGQRQASGGAREDSLIEELFQLLSLQGPQLSDKPEQPSAIRVNPIWLPVHETQTPQVYGILAEAPPEAPRTEPAATRTSTVILVKVTGEVMFVERDIYKLAEDGEVIMGSAKDERRFDFIVSDI